MLSLLALLAGVMPAQDMPPPVRSQEASGRTYVQIRLKAPDDLRVPRSQRQALDKMAPHDVAKYPRLVPQDDSARHVAWYFSTGPTLEFLALAGPNRGGRFKLLYPTENGSKEIDLTIDLSTAVNVPAPAKRSPRSPAVDDLEGRWAAAWAREFALRERLSDATVFADVRRELCRRYGVADPLPRPAPPQPEAPAAFTIDIADLRPPEPADHPWQQLIAGRTPPVETLARVTPADFYYIRLRSPVGAYIVLDRMLRTAGLAASLWDNAGQDYRLRERYLKQLAFPRDARGQLDFPKRARETAVIGSDLHFRMGTDLTVLFLTDNGLAEELDAGLAAARQEFGKAIREESFEHESVTVTGHVTEGGELRCYRASIGGLVICSNSPAAVRRVLDVIRRKAPALADSPDFVLARCLYPPDAIAEDLLAFFGESFQLAQLGPRHRLLLARRTTELAQQRAKRHTSLLAAWDRGAPLPPPTFSPPLLERTIDKVSRAEDAAYQAFSERIRSDFEPLLAPVALRFQESRGALRVEAFVMAPRRANTWDEVRRKLGGAPLARELFEYPGTAARVIASVTTSEMDWLKLKKWLLAQGLDKRTLDKHIPWHGQRMSLHLDGGPALAQLAEYYLHADLTAEEIARSRSDRELYWRLSQLPLTFGIEIARPLIFLGSMKQLQQLVLNAFPKVVTWEVLKEEYRRIKLTRVQPNAAMLMLALGKMLKPEEAPGIFYAHGDGTLILAPNLPALKAGIEREVFGNNRRVNRERAALWLTLNIGEQLDLQAYLRTYAEREAHRRALGAAVVWQWLHEAGQAKHTLQLLGYLPASPDGAAFRWDAQRQEMISQRHGSPRQPVLNPQPATDSPWLRTVADFGRILGEAHVRPDGLLGVIVIERHPPTAAPRRP